MATTPNQMMAGVPHIQVAGQQWPVPLLAPRQNRRIIPALMKFRHAIRDLQAMELTTEQFDALLEIVHLALTRAHPLLKYEEFLDWAITGEELLAAFPIITLQTGIFKPAPEGNQMGEGEVKAAPENPQTGTE